MIVQKLLPQELGVISSSRSLKVFVKCMQLTIAQMKIVSLSPETQRETMSDATSLTLSKGILTASFVQS